MVIYTYRITVIDSIGLFDPQKDERLGFFRLVIRDYQKFFSLMWE